MQEWCWQFRKEQTDIHKEGVKNDNESIEHVNSVKRDQLLRGKMERKKKH